MSDISIPRAGAVDLTFEAPPSKSYTHRALIAASLAAGGSELLSPLESDDTWITEKALIRLGVPLARTKASIAVKGTSGRLTCRTGATFDMGNSGTSLRLLLPVALLCRNPVTVTGSKRMQDRPLSPLVEGLNQLGGSVQYLEKEGYPPVVTGGVLRGGEVAMDGRISSQFISSILLSAPYAERDVDVTLTTEPVSRPYIDITLDVMESFGVAVDRDLYRSFHVPAGSPYRGIQYRVEGDYSSASYFFAIAAATGGRVIVHGLNPSSVQGDRAFLRALEEMGCDVTESTDTIIVSREGDLCGVDIDMSSSPDTVQTLCMVAAIARSPSRITGIGHLAWKESNRLSSTVALLRSIGGDATADDNSISITPVPLRGGVIDPADDHRTAMSFAVLGLATGGITIRNAECVGKSFPGFWRHLQEAGLCEG